MLRAVIFDMDNTIVLSEKYHIKATQTVLKRYGIEVPVELFYHHYIGRGSTYIIRDLFSKNNISDPLIEAKKEKNKLYREMIENEKLEIVPGFKEFFAKLKDKNIKTILASGSEMENIIATLKRTEIKELFPVCISAHDQEKPKPAPDIFLEAVKRLKLDTSECLVFEDAYSGLQAAKSAKIRIAGIATSLSKKELLEAGADYAFSDYTEIKLEKLIKEF